GDAQGPPRRLVGVGRRPQPCAVVGRVQTAAAQQGGGQNQQEVRDILAGEHTGIPSAWGQTAAAPTPRGGKAHYTDRGAAGRRISAVVEFCAACLANLHRISVETIRREASFSAERTAKP